MRVLMGLLLGSTVLALAFWAYQENYRTRETLAEVRAVQAEIGRLQEQYGVLRAEWAYLNRPDRLRELAALNFPRLGLMPMNSGQFGRVSAIAYPPPDVEVAGTEIIDGMPTLPNMGTEDGLPPPGAVPVFAPVAAPAADPVPADPAQSQPQAFASTAPAPAVDEAVFEEVAPIGGEAGDE